MSSEAIPVTKYDIHIYFTQETREEAVELFELAKQKFPNQRYLWSDKPIGPHPTVLHLQIFQLII